MECMRWIFILSVFWLFVPLASCTNETYVADLTGCQHGLCDWQWRWKIFTPLVAGKTSFFEGGNATISISQPTQRIYANLRLYTTWTFNELIKESPFVLPEDSYCLTKVGANLSVHCENPTDLPGIRESGIYCFDPNTVPTYHVYRLDTITRPMRVELNFTINMENSTVVLPFECSTSTYGDCVYQGNGSVPNVNTYFPILSGTLNRDFGSIDYSTLFMVVPSAVPLYPFAAFPTDAFLLQDEGLLAQGLLRAPKCQLDASQPTANNTSDHFPPGSKIYFQDWYGANLSTGVLRTRQFAPLMMYLDTTDPYLFSWLELDAYIPQRNYSALFTSLAM